MDENTEELTPIRRHGGFRVKRDDLYEVAGVSGGKARTCWKLAQGAKGLITAGSRSSPQVNIVAQIAHHLGIPCRVHTPGGKKTPELLDAEAAGAELIQHFPGHNNVIIARAQEDVARHRGWTVIPFGMEDPMAVQSTAMQVANLPRSGRIVVPVGSGMTLAGILAGLSRYERYNPVLGVLVGADPTRRLNRFAPLRKFQKLELVRSELDYHESVEEKLGTLVLDPIYEAKCVPFLEVGDILWVVGIRKIAMVK